MIQVLFAPFQPSNAIRSRNRSDLVSILPSFLVSFFQGSYKYSSNKKEVIISDTMFILNCPSIPLILIPSL